MKCHHVQKTHRLTWWDKGYTTELVHSASGSFTYLQGQVTQSGAVAGRS